MKNKDQTNKILEELIKLLEIPENYYEKAVSRYKSMGDHFHRPESTIRDLDPFVYLQGSFRLGTAIRALFVEGGYDLDLVCRILADKTELSQEQLKALIGAEVISYSQANGFKEPPEDKRRCWTQQYQDEVDFHMDILPCIPAGDRYRRLLKEAGLDDRLREEAINITDKKNENYSKISPDWPRSNPRGFARWFKRRMNVTGIASEKRKMLFEGRLRKYASVEEVPTYALKTPLQRAIQLLKGHRDQMFRDAPDGKPISIILTTLAGRAYEGEENLSDAVEGILDRMGSFVKQSKPRIENPADPTEDFADKWNRELEDNFLRWLSQANEDFSALGGITTGAGLVERVRDCFGVSLPPGVAKTCLAERVTAPAAVGLTRVRETAPRSWGII